MNKVRLVIGIPAHNEEKNIGKLLQNLLEQPLDEGVVLEKIIVVTSGCTDRTEEIVEAFARKDGRVKHFSEAERRGKISAVNLILRESRGSDVLLMLSADNLPAKGSIQEILKPFLQHGSLRKYEDKIGEKSEGGKEGEESRGKRSEVVGGGVDGREVDGRESVGCVSGHPVPVNDPRTFFGFASHLLWGLHHRISQREAKLTGEFFAMRVGIVEELPAVVNDDLYIEYAVKRRGYALVYAEKAVSFMRGPETLGDFFRQRVRVHVGHMQIAAMTGYKPKTASIYENIRHLKDFFTLRRIHFIAGAVLLEAFARFLAFFHFKFRKIPLTWEHAKTTKIVQ
ncbi:MAG: glycosyltransferase [Candidatus Methanospirare jalkutatii]|nr:glycosyltransferase [Candidatus Methanospirare jalkutatii]